MNFPRSYRDATPGNLILDKPNPDGSVVTSSTRAVNLYKYLGVIFDPGLKWTLQQAKVTASANLLVITNLVSLQVFERDVSIWGKTVVQTVVVPASPTAQRYGIRVLLNCGTKATPKARWQSRASLKSIHRKVAMTITGAIRTTAGDILDAHANILPIDLLFNKVSSGLLRISARSHALTPYMPSSVQPTAARSSTTNLQFTICSPT